MPKYSFATKWTLNLLTLCHMTCVYFTLNIHLHPITFSSCGTSTCSHLARSNSDLLCKALEFEVIVPRPLSQKGGRGLVYFECFLGPGSRPGCRTGQLNGSHMKPSGLLTKKMKAFFLCISAPSSSNTPGSVERQGIVRDIKSGLAKGKPVLKVRPV